MATHTPGPWKHNCEMVAAYGRMIATCDGGTWNDMDEAEANARLIAAAPDLLEALRELLAHASFVGIAPHYEKAARAAIAKATGERS